MNEQAALEETVDVYILDNSKKIFVDVRMSESHRKTEIKFPKEIPYGQGIWTIRAEEFVVSTVCLPERRDREHSALTLTYAKGQKGFNTEYMGMEEVKHRRQEEEAVHNNKIAELRARYEAHHGCDYEIVERVCNP